MKKLHLTIFWIALDHLIAGLKAGGGDGVHPELLMVCRLCGHQWGVGGQGVMYPGVGDLVTQVIKRSCV